MKRLSLLLITLFALSNLAEGQKVWVGNVSSDWNNANNWSPAGVPGAGDNIIIGPVSGGNNQPSIATLEMGQWNRPSSLIIQNNAVLTITNSIVMAGTNSVTLKSGGRISHTGTTATLWPNSGTSTFTIENGQFSTNANFTVNSNLTVDTGSFTVNGNLIINGNRTLTNRYAKLVVNGNLQLNNSGSTFRSGNDTVIINGRLLAGGNNFYGDSAYVEINGNGNNTISGDFYTNAATIKFNPNSFTEIGSGGRFYANSGTVYFNDSVRAGNNGKIFANAGTIYFSKSIVVSANGEIDAGSGTIVFEGNATFTNNGTMNAGSGDITFGGDVTVNNSGGTINAGSANITISGNINNSGNFNPGTSTVVLNGDSTQTISNNITFHNLVIETEGSVVANGNITVNNNAIIGSNTEVVISNPNSQVLVVGELVDSSGTIAANAAKPFVMKIEAQDSVTIWVFFNEQVTQASVQNASNSTWTGRTISSRTLIDTNILRIVFTPAIVRDVEYTLTFQNIVNTRTPAGTMNTGHTKKFTWASPSTPTTASSNLSFPVISNTQIKLQWTKGNGQRRLVIARQADSVNTLPTNGNEYTANANLGSGQELGTGNFVVYNGTGDSFTVSGLSAGVNYHFAIIEYNGSGALANYQTSNVLKGSQTALPSLPNVPPSDLGVTSFTDTTITLSWTRGNGAGILVLIKNGTEITQAPVNGEDYTANNQFGLGEDIGDSTFVVYKGTGSEVTILGLQANRNYSFAVFEFNGSGNSISYAVVNQPKIITNTGLRIKLKVFLEGPFDGNAMSTAIQSYIPLEQSFNVAPWNYAGNEWVSALPNDSIVDWVLIELRRADSASVANGDSVVARKAAFILSNGSIVDLDGFSPVLMEIAQPGKMFVLVHHRNHLPVQSADSVTFTNGLFEYDFTDSDSNALGTNSMILINGKYCMIGGKAVFSESLTISEDDIIQVWENRNAVGYSIYDINMDGLVDAGDRSAIYNNLSKTTTIIE